MTPKEAAIKGVPLFASCSKRELALLATLVDEIDLPAGKVLMSEGETGKEFFIIRSGSAEVSRDGAVVATLGAGDFFGEIALVKRVPRTATVTTTSPVDALVLSGQAFAGLRDELPNLDRAVLAEIEARPHAETGEN
jgi:CRP-like cAMP-binding protein